MSKRIYLYFAGSDMQAYERLKELCPPSVPLATFARSVLVRYAFGRLEYAASPEAHEHQRSVMSEASSATQETPETSARFLAGIEGMLAEAEAEAEEGDDHA